VAAVQTDIRAAIAGGTKEVVLTGVELGAWGKDLVPAMGLGDLIEAVLQNSDLRRLRLSSIEPWDFDPQMLSLWQDESLCHHLHIPLQSGDDRVLRAMGRAMKSAGYALLIATIRKALPDVAITADVIAGFPGETDAEFAATKDFIRQMGFAGGHVFTYSPRPGTAAYKMEDQVERNVAKARNAELRQVFHELGRDYQKQFIGESLSVLWETHTETPPGTWQLSGLTGNYLRVYAPSNQPLWNRISQVRITGEHQKRGGLKGSIELTKGKITNSA
jgi:threonylcarbamoyladenosine tRNA methylthiotransferase MtaB